MYLITVKRKQNISQYLHEGSSSYSESGLAAAWWVETPEMGKKSGIENVDWRSWVM